MARYTFGGDIHDLITRPDTTLGGALKVAANTAVAFYTVATGGSAVTDFLIDADGNGTFETAATSVSSRSTGYLPDFQGPDGISVLYYDPDVTDSDVRRVRYVARDADFGGLVTSSETAVGVNRFATTAESDAGVLNTVSMTPAKVAARILAHANSSTAHPALSDAITDLTNSMLNKADLVSGDVPVEQLPAATGAVVGQLALRGSTVGRATFGVDQAVNSDEPVTLAQAQGLLTTLSGADVRHRVASLGTGLTSTTATNWITIPDMNVTDAASGQQWRFESDLIFQVATAGGFQIRPKIGAVGTTNLIPDPSFESGTTGWAVQGTNSTFARTVGTSFDGSAFALFTSTGAGGNIIVQGPWVALSGATQITAAVRGYLHAGTGRIYRIDIQYAQDSAGTNAGGWDLGPASQKVTAAANWSTVSTNGASTASVPPAGMTHVRVRIVYESTVAGDAVRLDGVQLEPVFPLPAWGSTGGSGAGLSVTGSYGPGLVTTSPTTNTYSKVTPIRAVTTSAGGVALFGGLGATTDAFLPFSHLITVGGTGLTGQRIEYEFAANDSTNNAKLMAANATIARVV